MATLSISGALHDRRIHFYIFTCRLRCWSTTQLVPLAYRFPQSTVSIHSLKCPDCKKGSLDIRVTEGWTGKVKDVPRSYWSVHNL